MNKKVLRSLVVSALFGAVGFILMFIELGVPIMPSFIKFDISELPALIASFAYGPLYGVLVCFLKNALHLLVTSTAGVGELANFLMGIFFVVPAGWIYRHRKSRGSALLGSLIGSLSLGFFCVLINYFLVYPIYYKIMIPKAVILSAYQAILPAVDSIFESLLIFNFPFTTVKGIIVSILCFLIYKKLSPILKK
ncbi:MAG: ECF transporter S component [Clostridia bacterium]|nr:ECF transporter S component [Clostridia bacterium]